MNLGNPQIQQAIIDIAETSESNEVAEACRLVIADYLEQGDTEISGAREVILTAIECVERTKQMVSEKLQQAIDRIRRYKSGERAEDVWQKPSGTLGSRADYLEDACFVADYVVFPNLMELMEASDEATESRSETDGNK